MEAHVALGVNDVAALERGEEYSFAGPGSRARLLRRLLRNPLTVIGLVIIVVLVVMTLAAPLLTPSDPQVVDVPQRFLPPSAQHPFGTDELGRDLFSRVLYGGRLSLPAPFEVVALALLVGSTIGAVA